MTKNKIFISAAVAAVLSSLSVPLLAGEYLVKNQWGGSAAPWHEGGLYVIGTRGAKQRVIAMNLSSMDNGRTLTGTMTYQDEGPIGFRANKIMENTYFVENQWGGSSAPWHPGGPMILGARANQPIVALNITSADNGVTLTGTMTYAGEGPIGFVGQLRP